VQDVLTAAEVASIFKVHVSAVSRWATSGKLAGFKTPGGGGWRFHRSDVEAFIPEPADPAEVAS
jgi:excisionase family DNA binding protein